MPNGRGMVMRGQGTPAHLVRPARAPTRHPTQNPGVGMNSFIRQKTAMKEFLVERLGEIRSRV